MVRQWQVGPLLAVVLFGGCSSGDGVGQADDDLKPAISTAATQAVPMLQAQADTLGRTTLPKPLGDSLRPFLDSMKAATALFPAAAGDGDEADANTLVYVGMKLTLWQASRPAGTAAPTAQASSEAQVLDELLEAADRDNVRDFDNDQVNEEVRRVLRPLAAVALLSSPELIKQLLPPGSPEASRFGAWVRYDDQGNPTVAIPPPSQGEETTEDPASWNQFVTTLVDERSSGSTFGDALTTIDEDVERFELPRG